MGVGKTKLSACHSLLLFQERGTEEWTLLNKMQAKGVLSTQLTKQEERSGLGKSPAGNSNEHVRE